MRLTLISSVAAFLLLAVGGKQLSLVQACQDHGQQHGGDDQQQQWTITPEELVELKELERKWGTDVSSSFSSIPIWPASDICTLFSLWLSS